MRLIRSEPRHKQDAVLFLYPKLDAITLNSIPVAFTPLVKSHRSIGCGELFAGLLRNFDIEAGYDDDADKLRISAQ